MCSKLTSHIRNCHRSNKTVKEILKLKSSERKDAFQDLKRKGIIEFNKREAAKDQPAYQSERQSKKYKNVVLCSSCSSFISKRFFSIHKKRCRSKTDAPASAIPMFEHTLLLQSSQKLSSEFLTTVLSKVRNDDIGNLVRQDEFILYLGQKYYLKNRHKKSKIGTVRKTARSEMRLLAKLYQTVKSYQSFLKVNDNLTDMFIRDNFYTLSDALDDITNNEDGMKAGLRQKAYYLIIGASKRLRDKFFIEKQEDLSKEIGSFLAAVKSSEELFLSNAQYNLENARLTTIRKPCRLPLEEDIKVLHSYIQRRLKELADSYIFWSPSTFIQQRNLVMVRLTLLNARRGGEVGRLLLNEWRDADNESWIDNQRIKTLSEADQILVRANKIAYQAGKGNKHVVSILIPEDAVKPMQNLSDPEIRKLVGVAASNNFLFASTQLSDLPFSGWHALKDICSEVDLSKPELINATTNRHRVSTIYAGLDLNDNDRELFYKHMGHSAQMNREVYQAPLALAGITNVGRNLLNIESGGLSTLFLISHYDYL